MIVLFLLRAHGQSCCSAACIVDWLDHFIHIHETKAHKRFAIYIERLSKFDILFCYSTMCMSFKWKAHMKHSILVKGLWIRIR
jgi:hypothetical protein